MSETHLWTIGGWFALALLCGGLALWFHLVRHGVRLGLQVRYSGDDSPDLPVTELLLASVATILTGVVLYEIARGHDQELRLIWASAGAALVLAAVYWTWSIVREFSQQESEEQREWRRTAAETGRQIRQCLEESEVRAAACQALKQRLAASDVRLFLREGQSFKIAYDTTGREREPRSYSYDAPLAALVRETPAGMPFVFHDNGPRLAAPLTAGLALDGFFLVSGGPYSLPQLRFAASVGHETARALELAGEIGKEAERRAAAKVDRREKEHTLRALDHLVAPDSPMVAGLDFATGVWRGDRPGGQFIDVLALPRETLGIVLAELPGYGLDSAVRMSRLQTLLRSRFWAYAEDLPELLQSTSRALLAANPATAPIRIFLACYRPASRTLTYVNAGALPPILVRRGGEGAQVLRLSVSAPLLCADGDTPAQVADLVLEPGDLLAMVSTPLVETLNLQGEAWGETRLIETLMNGEAQPAAGLVPLVLHAADVHAGQGLSAPDRVMILLKT